MAADGTNAMFGSTASGMPLSHLDYGYIGKCTDAAQLEKIVKALRSGDEGTYPELTTFAEKQLESINPKSKVLRKDVPIQSYRDLESSERDQLSHEFKDWFSEINHKDSQLKQDSKPTNTDYLPPVRSCKTVGSTTSATSQVCSDRVDKSKRTAVPRGYQDWDRFDPDKELETLEQKEEQELKAKREKAKVNSKEGDVPVNIDTSGKTEAEKTVLADREKDKGNEAFRSGDYKESLIYYSRSIQYKPSAASYNNRAYANLKLEKYKETIDDCNVVIRMEPSNLKAFLRRALAHKGRGENANARSDLNKVLDIEPNNKRAKEILTELSKNQPINNNTKQANGESIPKKKGKRMKIIEVENEESTAIKEEKPTEKSNQNGSSDSTDGNRLSLSKSNEKNSKVQSSGANERGNENSRSKNENENPGSEIKSGISKPGNVNETSASEKVTENLANIEKSSSLQNEFKGKEESSTAVAENHKEIVQVTPAPVVELPGVVVKIKDEGTSLYKLGRYAEASEKFSTAIEILEKDKSQFQSALSSLLNNRAACLHRIGDAFGCIKDCTASLALIPGSAKPLLKRASSNEMLERYEEAYVDFNAVVLADPSNQAAINGKSRVSKHLINTYGKSWRERLTNIQVSHTPTSSELLNTGDSSTAEESFNILGKKMTANPSKPTRTSDMPTTTSVKPTMNPNKLTKDTGIPTKVSSIPTTSKQESAEKKFEQSKEKGNTFVKQGKLEQAIQCYTECIEVDPSKVAVYTNRALCYLRLQKFVLAEDDTTKALKLEEDNVKALYRRGLARKALEKYDEAAKDLLNLIKIEPTNPSGRKELDIVLNLCREQRKKQKPSVNPNPKNTASQANVNENKGKQKKETKRRRVQIEEVEEISSDASSPSVPQKTPDAAPPKPNSTNTNKDVPTKTVQVESKPKTSQAKQQKKNKIKLHKATAFDFSQAWNSVKQKDLSSYADILRQLNPAMLPKVLSNKLDADMFRCIIGSITDQLLPNGEDKLSFEILQYLSLAKRFDMIKMFLDGNDSKAVRDICSKLSTTRTKTGFVDADTFNSIVNKYNVSI